MGMRVGMGMRVVVAMIMTVVMVTMVMMVVMPVLPVGMPLEPCIAAAAYRAHQITSMSLIRISSPPSGISLPPPQFGQGSSRLSISTCVMQS